MSPKRKPKKETSISITGGVRGTGNVVGNDSRSDVSISNSAKQSSSSHQMFWGRLVAFLVALIGVLASIALFVRLLEGFDVLLIAELVLASLIGAFGISGVLKPKMLFDLFGKMIGKK